MTGATVLLYFISIISFMHTFKISAGKPACKISTNEDLGVPQPLILKSNGFDFYLPENKNGDITFLANETIYLACPGKNNYLSVNNVEKTNETHATCQSNKLFVLKGSNQSIEFSKIICAKYPWHTARRTGNKCYNSSSEVEIGFQLNTNFIRHILLCYNEIKKDTFYSFFNLTSAIHGYQKQFPRPQFIEGDFYKDLNPKPSKLYTRNQTIDTFSVILGSRSLAEKYIHTKGEFFLARGHMTAKADFVYGSQHRMTFYYINVAPQWQIINAGNWLEIESDTRTFASERQLDLEVYTGTFGACKLPDRNETQQELYLYIGSNNKNAITVPQVYWKVLYDRKGKSGIAFISVNNPYFLDSKKDIFCDDISEKIPWLSWDRKNITLGYSYSCEVNDFRKTVKSLPPFQVDNILM